MYRIGNRYLADVQRNARYLCAMVIIAGKLCVNICIFFQLLRVDDCLYLRNLPHQRYGTGNGYGLCAQNRVGKGNVTVGLAV